jgi:hypothetical protein
MMNATAIAAAARRAWPFLPEAAPAGSWWQGPGGEVVRVEADGSASPLAAPGHPRPGVAADPCARRKKEFFQRRALLGRAGVRPAARGVRDADAPGTPRGNTSLSAAPAARGEADDEA